MRILFNCVFLVFTVYLFVRSVAYGLYEIRQEKNKLGGFAVICFNCSVLVFSNVVMWLS